MVALYIVWYNLVKMHKTLKMTPTLAVGVADGFRSIEDFISLIDAREAIPAKRGPYAKRVA